MHDMSWKRDFPMASVLAVATVAFTIRTAKAELRDLVTKVAPASSRIATRRRTCSTRGSATDQSFAHPDARDQRFEARVGADGIEEALEHRLAREERSVNRGRAREQCDCAAFCRDAHEDPRRRRVRAALFPDRRLEVSGDLRRLRRL